MLAAPWILQQPMPGCIYAVIPRTHEVDGLAEDPIAFGLIEGQFLGLAHAAEIGQL